MTRTHLTPSSRGLTLNTLLIASGETLQNLESRLSGALENQAIGDICLKHIEFEGTHYPVWCIVIENGSIRAYDTHEECIQVHAYRGLPSVQLFTMQSREERERQAQEQMERLLELQEAIEKSKSSIIGRPLDDKPLVKISTIGSPLTDPPTSEPSILQKIREKMGKDLFSDWRKL